LLESELEKLTKSPLVVDHQNPGRLAGDAHSQTHSRTQNSCFRYNRTNYDS
jgi:hypothetical protein